VQSTLVERECCGLCCRRYPAHIHILKVNPDSRDRVQAGKLWGAEGKKGGAQEDEAADDNEVGLQKGVRRHGVTEGCAKAWGGR
jgi:hypothetical protein